MMGRSIVVLSIVIAVGATAFWSRGLVLVIAGWVPFLLNVVRITFVKTNQGLYRWALVNTVASGVCVGAGALATGGIASPVLVFTIIIGLVASMTFTHEWRWILYPVVVVVAVGAIDALAGGWDDSDWLYLVSLLIMTLAVPRLVADSVKLEFAYRTKAVLDPLTGCLNRTSLAMRLSEIELQAARSAEPVGVIAIDIDRFKKINDRHGHRAGDEVLQAVAYAIRKRLRRFELFYRTGGEEFLLLLPGADLTHTHRLAESIRTTVETEEIRITSVTVSLGVAAEHAPSSLARLIDRADRALLDAKHRGRNRTVVAAGIV